MSYHELIREVAMCIIENDLTVRRKDNGLEPFCPKQINEFVFENEGKIQDAIKHMIRDYIDLRQESLLMDPQIPWVDEYLREFVDIDSLVEEK